LSIDDITSAASTTIYSRILVNSVSSWHSGMTLLSGVPT